LPQSFVHGKAIRANPAADDTDSGRDGDQLLARRRALPSGHTLTWSLARQVARSGPPRDSFYGHEIELSPR
jgi:hypothetical protein